MIILCQQIDDYLKKYSFLGDNKIDDHCNGKISSEMFEINIKIICKDQIFGIYWRNECQIAQNLKDNKVYSAQ